MIEIDIDGQNISSEDLATKISDLGLSGSSDITFILADTTKSVAIKENIDFRLSISRMTMDLNILTMILFEQIYRAYRIINNEPYHK